MLKEAQLDPQMLAQAFKPASWAARVLKEQMPIICTARRELARARATRVGYCGNSRRTI